MLKLIVISCAALLALATPTLAGDEAPPAAQPAATEAATQANADVPQAVKDACQGDYEKYCSQHQPESDEVRVCMAGAFEKLSDPCVTAILDSPLAEQAAEQVEAARAQETEAEADRSELAETPAAAPRHNRVSRAARVQTPAPRKSVGVVAQHGKKRVAHAKVTVRLARIRPTAHKNVRYAAYRTSKPRRSVAGYIKRGTGIANYYVAKYTRIGFAKAFR